MGLFDIFSRKKRVPTEDERRDHLLKHGRITEGTIIDTETDDYGDEIAYYVYSIQGVDFESSEKLTGDQRRDAAAYSPGAKVSIRFDTRNHGNSILV